MSREKQIEEMVTDIGEKQECGWKFVDNSEYTTDVFNYELAEHLYNAGYRKQNDEELIDKIATYFEKEDNWTKLKYAWNICGKSVQLRDMLRDAITEAKMKGENDD